MPVSTASDLAMDLTVALLGTADSWPLLLLVLFVVVPAVWSRDAHRRRRARQVLRMLRLPHQPHDAEGVDEEPRP